MYAKSTGNNATNGTTGVELNFQHALTEISVAAKNSNTAYTVKVTGVKLGNVKTKGTFTFPSIENSAASWTLSDATADVGSYETTWSNASVLTSSVSTLDETNVAFMLLPQQLEKSDKASEKAYLALKVSITMQGGKVIHDGWAYIGLNTNWEMGKHYTYTLDFSDGAGQDENGKQIISGKEMVLNVKVTPWNEKAIAYPSFITGTATGELTYKVGGQNGTKYTVTPDASGNWSIPVAKFDGVTNMNSMFYNCLSLKTLDLSSWDVSNVTNMYQMFGSCRSLTSLDVSHFNTEKVADMREMFFGCRSLTSLDVSNFNTKNVTDIHHMFCSCESLTSLDLSHFSIGRVSNMNCMFYNCQSLTSLDLSGWDTSNVTNMSDMFLACSNLKTIKMKGCNEATINKIKAQLATDGITGCIIVTE